MGRVSKELKEITKKTKEKTFPVLGKDYYLLKVNMGESIPAGCLATVVRRSYISKDHVAALLASSKGQPTNPAKFSPYRPLWAIYPGPKPDPKWGKICP